MQTIHKVCLILTGLCVVIVCVGIGLGIPYIGKSDSNDTISEYQAYDEDYVDFDSVTVNNSISVRHSSFRGVIDTKSKEEVIRDGYTKHL